jgi:hypothetical protein
MKLSTGRTSQLIKKSGGRGISAVALTGKLIDAAGDA